MKWWRFIAGALVVLVVGALLPRLATNAYIFYAGFVALQYVVIATGWNVLGGYAGYVNFGSGAFVGLGTYTAVFLFNAIAAPLWVQILGAALVGGLLGLGMGYLTLRIQGVYFSIATLALTVVLNTFIVNWAFVGGARGAAVLAPKATGWFPARSPMSSSPCWCWLSSAWRSRAGSRVRGSAVAWPLSGPTKRRPRAPACPP